MAIPKKPRGRPLKEKDRIEDLQFGRAAMVLVAYDEARQSGQKHSCAVKQAVEVVRQDDPEIPISESEVRRVLATFRPREGRTVLLFERTALSEEELRTHRVLREQLAILSGKHKLELPPEIYSSRRAEIFQIRLGERPFYPRHNRREPAA